MMLGALPADYALLALIGMLAWGAYLALDGWFMFRDWRADRRVARQSKHESLLSEIADLERELDLGRE